MLLATEVIDTETFSDMHDTALKMLANSWWLTKLGKFTSYYSLYFSNHKFTIALQMTLLRTLSSYCYFRALTDEFIFGFEQTVSHHN